MLHLHLLAGNTGFKKTAAYFFSILFRLCVGHAIIIISGYIFSRFSHMLLMDLVSSEFSQNYYLSL